MFLSHTKSISKVLDGFLRIDSATQAYSFLWLCHPPADLGVLQYQPEDEERVMQKAHLLFNHFGPEVIHFGSHATGEDQSCGLI